MFSAFPSHVSCAVTKCVSRSQASVMVEYSYDEAITLLETNLANALDKQVREVNSWYVVP